MIPGVNAPYIHPCVEVKEAKINIYLLLSYTTVSNQILNELLTDKVGTDEILLLKDKFNQKEITDFEIIVGKSFVEGNYIDTTFEKVYYFRTGTLVVQYVNKEVE
ncbi:TPA: hypothetical protein PEJ78_000228 [Staphylococcus aureus]|nr:hypothetical protein [Staphylococcus aureus]